MSFTTSLNGRMMQLLQNVTVYNNVVPITFMSFKGKNSISTFVETEKVQWMKFSCILW